MKNPQHKMLIAYVLLCNEGVLNSKHQIIVFKWKIFNIYVSSSYRYLLTTCMVDEIVICLNHGVSLCGIWITQSIYNIVSMSIAFQLP